MSRCFRPVALLLLLLLHADARRLFSRLRLGRRDDSASDGAEAAANFGRAVEKLRDGPGGAEAVGEVLRCLERVRDAPRGADARRLCLWEPTIRSRLADAEGGLDALRAAGFSDRVTDARGTPFLVMRRMRPEILRLLIGVAADAVARSFSAAAVEAAAAEAGAAAAAAAAVAAAGGVGEAEESERALVSQISSMISGLISEYERGNSPASAEASAMSQGEEGAEPGAEGNSSSKPPVHFRVYRSSGPSFPPGFGGVPFMPGGGMPGGMPGFPGGSPGGEDEDGDVPQLERRVKAAALPAEAEEVAQRELKRLRRMSPMHSEYASR